MRTAVKGLLAVTLMGCSGEPEPTGATIQWPAPKPYQVDGEQGNIVVSRLDRPENPRVDVFAVFGDDLQGFDNAAACAQDFMPCVGGPRLPYGEVAFLSNTRFWPDATAYTWVGDEMLIGSSIADFVHDPESGLAAYRGGGDQRPTGSVRVRLGGEWTDLDAAMGFLLPDFEVTAPDLAVDQRLDLSGPPVTFEWDSLGGREIWLWAQGEFSRRLVRVPDTGSYTLNPFELGLGPAEKVEIGLAAVTTDSLDVAGNELDVLTLSGAGWTGSVCGDFLDVPIEATPPPEFDSPRQPAFYGYGFNGIIDDGIRDYRDIDTGELRSAEMYFDFYDEDFQRVCTIRYDASDAAKRPPLILDSEAEQYATFRISLFNGESTCGRIDPTITGYQDLRNFVEQYDWSFSVGDLTDLVDPLRAGFGEDIWANQGQFVFGMFWSQDGLFGQERGYGYHTATPTCYQGSLNAAHLAPDGELNDGYYFTFPYYIDRL